MKRPLALHISAIVIGLAIAVASFIWLDRANFRTSSAPLVKIGEISTIEGRLDHRPPGATKTEVVSEPESEATILPLHHQELLITQRASSAVVKFSPSGTVLRLLESTRFVAELDPDKEGAINATILDGAVTILEPGKRELFRIYKAGEELKFNGTSTLGVKSVPVIDVGTAPSAEPETEFKLIVTATKAAETSKPSRMEVDSHPGEPSSDILTNEDIIRRLRGQAGFFQRCYLNHINREQAKTNATTMAAGATRVDTGVIVTSFTIQTSGRVNEARIVRSDFKDSVLHNCVTEVIERTAFRGFKGEPVPVREFPISFQ